MSKGKRKGDYLKPRLIAIAVAATVAIVGVVFVGAKGGSPFAQITASCTDSDGGLNYNVKGGASRNTPPYTDSCYCPIGSDRTNLGACTSGPFVGEWFCNANGYTEMKTYECPNGCNNGACIAQANAACGDDVVDASKGEECDDGTENGKNGYCTTQCTRASCTDTDGGNNEFQKGVTRSGFGEVTGAEDICADDGKSVYEAYCDGNIIMSSVRITCANGCQNGACLKEADVTCSDSDGADISRRGIVRTNKPHWDPENVDGCLVRTGDGLFDGVASCSGENCYLNEFICENSEPTYLNNQPVHCPNGCRDGACIPSSDPPSTLCTDTDGGINLSTRGEARQGQKQVRDFCQENNVIFEHDCGTAGGVSESTHPELGGSQFRCPENTVCRDGACIPSSDTPENCEPLICSDGSVFPQCTPEGYPIAYFQDPCRSLDMSAPPTIPTAGFEDEVRVVPVAPAIFSDVRVGSDVASAAQSLAERGVIGGYPDGTFREERPVNRAELAKFLLLAKGSPVPERANEGRFRDVLEGEWYVKFVMEAAMQGIIDGYPDGTFRPANTVNVAEFLKMTTKALGLPENYPYAYADVSPQDWFSPYAGLAERFELFGRSSSLNPGHLLTRGEVAVALEKALIILK